MHVVNCITDPSWGNTKIIRGRQTGILGLQGIDQIAEDGGVGTADRM